MLLTSLLFIINDITMTKSETKSILQISDRFTNKIDTYYIKKIVP